MCAGLGGGLEDAELHDRAARELGPRTAERYQLLGIPESGVDKRQRGGQVPRRIDRAVKSCVAAPAGRRETSVGQPCRRVTREKKRLT